MVITNLATPEWITINCNESLTTDFMCYFENEKEPTITDRLTSVIFNANCIIKEGICFVFHWVQSNYTRNQCDKSLKHLNDIKSFKFLFDAIRARISPILYFNCKWKLTYQKYAGVYDFKVEKTNENFDGFVVSKLNPVSEIIVGLNIFRCGKDLLISIILVCNGHNDCPEHDPLDEMECKSKMTGNGLKMCSYFYMQTVDNSCYIYDNVYNNMFSSLYDS